MKPGNDKEGFLSGAMGAQGCSISLVQGQHLREGDLCFRGFSNKPRKAEKKGILKGNSVHEGTVT